MTQPATILILAAGSSSRMRGGDKLLEQIDSIPQLTRITRAALATGAAVLVALPPDRPARLATLQGLPVQTVMVPDAQDGMAQSIRAGLAQASPTHTLMILPADMPDLSADDLHLMVQAHAETPDQILRATAQDGTPGHPVIFPPRLFAALSRISGDTGARAALQGQDVRLLALPGTHAITDLDTPEDWAAWRASRAP